MRLGDINEFISFDTETTGVDIKTDRIVQSSLIYCSLSPKSRLANGEYAPELDNFAADYRVDNLYINPGVPIPQGAINVHKITDEFVQKHGVEASKGVNEVAEKLSDAIRRGIPIVIYNAGYDLGILRYELARHRLPSLEERVGREIVEIIDPFCLDRILDKYRKGKRNLEAVAAEYKLQSVAGLHDASVDATLTMDLLNAIMARYPELLQKTLRELFEFQRDGFREWAVSRNEWARQNGAFLVGQNWLPA